MSTVGCSSNFVFASDSESDLGVSGGSSTALAFSSFSLASADSEVSGTSKFGSSLEGSKLGSCYSAMFGSGTSSTSSMISILMMPA
jgi:hypothetical protein